MRPVNGAVTRENSRSSRASLIAALAVSMAACCAALVGGALVDGLRRAEARSA